MSEVWSADTSSGPVVIHIQDAHGHYAGQKNLANVLKLFASNNPEQLLPVYIEGAWTDMHPEWLTAFPYKEANRRTAESLLRMGLLTGEEYLTMTEGKQVLDIRGLEDETTYKYNLETRQMLDEQRR